MSGARKRQNAGIILVSAGLLAILPPAALLRAAPPLRHRLAVGDQLVYERRVQVTPLDGDSVLEGYTQQLQLWCLAREQEERLVLAELARVVDRQAGTTRGALFHMSPRGLRRFSPEIRARVAGLDPLFELIPILPPVLAGGSGWLSDPDHLGRRWRCTRAADDTSSESRVRVDFVLEDPTGVAEARGVTQRGVYWFDPHAGVVVRLESELRDRKTQRRVLAITHLHTRRKQEPLWCRQQVIEAEHFLRTLRLEDRLLDQITAEPDQLARILARIDRLWSELVLGIAGETQSPFRRLAQGQQALLAEKTKTCRERAQLAGQLLGSSAAHWSLQAPDGQTVRSETVRDRIVIECFWSANSPWSLRSFEVLRQVQEQLPPEDFRVVCLNIDTDVAAARQAVRLCGAGLTHVLAGPPLGGQPPSELPVFRVLDRDSQVLAVYFGWQPGLGEKISSLPR